MSSNEDEAIGYWEPHTSSIDFCETNYLFTTYVAEPHNCWSSIVGISLFGALGLLYGNPSRELRFSIAYAILVLIGIGSACLHATLHWVYQSSDELPMMYLIATYLYIFIELEARSLRYPNLPLYLVLLMAGNTLIYFTFQSLYWVFLLTFITGLSSYTFMIGKMVYEGKEMTKNSHSRKLIMLSVITFFFVGTPVWVIDMLHCHPSWLYGLTWHIVWHFTAGFGAYCTIVYLESFRMQSLGRDFSLRYIFGFIPVIEPNNLADYKSE